MIEADTIHELDRILVQAIEKMPKTKNSIILSKIPVTNLICIQGMRLYYSPSDICNFLERHAKCAMNCLVMIAEKTPTFLILLKLKTIDEAISLVAQLRKNPTPICSLDPLTYDFVKDFDFESDHLAHVVHRFRIDEFYDSNCAICLCQLISEMQLITLCCGHTMHAPCAQKMKQWECPLCRYAPISTIDATVCEVCGSFDRPFICLCCARSFCYEHCLEHFKETGHGYCASTDGRETWNLMSGTTMKRIAVDKSGEYVELCAKEDVLRSYLESALCKQLNVHREIQAQKSIAVAESLEQECVDLEREMREKRKLIEEMKVKIKNKSVYEKKIPIANSLLEKLKEKHAAAEETTKKLELENEKLKKEVLEKAELVKDMEGTACITAAAALRGKDQEVHIKFNQN